MRVLPPPAVEQHPGLTVGHVVAVGVGNEEQLRRRADPHPAEAHLETADEVQPLLKDRSLVEHMVAIGVFEDENPVLRRLGSDPPRIGIGLGHPEPAPVVEAHGDRLAHVGLRGEELHGKARRHRHRPGRRFGGEAVGQRHPLAGLGVFPPLERHLLPLLQMHEDALLVGHHRVGQSVARGIGRLRLLRPAEAPGEEGVGIAVRIERLRGGKLVPLDERRPRKPERPGHYVGSSIVIEVADARPLGEELTGERPRGEGDERPRGVVGHTATRTFHARCTCQDSRRHQEWTHQTASPLGR